MKTLTIFIFIISSVLVAQEKYLVYFSDKGEHESFNSLNKVDRELLAKNYLSQKSIDRRMKTLGDEFFSIDDLPVSEKYISEIRALGIKIEKKLKWFNAVSVNLNENQLIELEKFNFIKSIEGVRKFKNSKSLEKETEVRDGLLKSSSTHSLDYGLSFTQNNLSDIPAVHDLGINGEGVIIGLLDSGFDWQTPNSLRDRNVIAEYDFLFNDNVTANESNDVSRSQHDHGTSVFSILAGYDEGYIIGPAFNASFLLAKTEDVVFETHLEEDNYAAALEWMDSIGVDIATSSLGYSEFDVGESSYTYNEMDGRTTVVTKAAEKAFERGITVITSAGNEGDDPWFYITAPGDGFNTLTIGAVTSSNIVTGFSSRGPSSDGRIKPEIVAMGSGVVNARADFSDRYSSGSGTSFSAPIAAGIAGLLLSHYPHLTNSQIRSIMMESGDNTESPNNEIGYGLISATKAISFPNISIEGEELFVNKTFIDSTLRHASSAEFEYMFNENDRQALVLTRMDEGVYKIQLPSTLEDTIKFAFILKDLNGDIIGREPESGDYYLNPNDIIIKKNISAPVSPTNPNEIFIDQNYPNPFNSESTIEYSLPIDQVETRVRLTLFNVLGQRVKTLVNEYQGPGLKRVKFNSSGMSSGVYFYQLEVGDFTKTKKLILLR